MNKKQRTSIYSAKDFNSQISSALTMNKKQEDPILVILSKCPLLHHFYLSKHLPSFDLYT